MKVDPIPFLKILNMDLYSLRNFLLELEFSIQLSSIRFKQNIQSNPILEHEILKSYFSISLTKKKFPKTEPTKKFLSLSPRNFLPNPKQSPNPTLENQFPKNLPFTLDPPSPEFISLDPTRNRSTRLSSIEEKSVRSRKGWIDGKGSVVFSTE